MASSSSRRARVIAGSLWIASGLVYVIAEAIAASAFPGYSYATNYISDLGVPDIGTYQGRAIDSPLHAVMNAGFVAHGILFLLAAVFAIRSAAAGPRRAFVALAAIHAIGICLVGTIPGSQTSVDNGLAIFHVAGATMAILAGNLAAVVAGLGSRRIGAARGYVVASVVIGTVGILCAIMLSVDSGSASIDLLPDGVWERAAVYSITVWELGTGVVLLVSSRAPKRIG